MPTTTTRKRTPRKASAPSPGDDRGLGSLEKVIDDLDRMRDHANEELRRQLESAVKRMRDVAGDLRDRTDERTTAVESAVSRVADDAWQQIAILAVRAQHDPAALTELSAEIRKRKAQLRPPAKRAPASKAG